MKSYSLTFSRLERENFLTVGGTCKAIAWPTPGLKERTLHSSGPRQRGTILEGIGSNVSFCLSFFLFFFLCSIEGSGLSIILDLNKIRANQKTSKTLLLRASAIFSAKSLSIAIWPKDWFSLNKTFKWRYGILSLMACISAAMKMPSSSQSYQKVFLLSPGT